ncbi:MAG: dehydrogenase [Synechococcus sp. ELA619]
MLVAVTDPLPQNRPGLGQLLPVLVSLVGLCAMPSASAQGAFARLTPLSLTAGFTGPRAALAKDWVGRVPLAPQTPILVLAGHADSQGIAGAGTSGAAVALRGAAKMQADIQDELYWNLRTAAAVVALGRSRGLEIQLYVPPVRDIASGDDPRTNWSVGKAFAAAGGYALEIHYDAYGPDGIGSGLMPPINRPSSQLDESLALAFGGYPRLFRGGLGAPKRGIALLEIGKLEGQLEASLRDPRRREASIAGIAERVVAAIERGLGINPPPGAVGSEPLGTGPQASSGGG